VPKLWARTDVEVAEAIVGEREHFKRGAGNDRGPEDNVQPPCTERQDHEADQNKLQSNQ
jgi:hypothetical protein